MCCWRSRKVPPTATPSCRPSASSPAAASRSARLVLSTPHQVDRRRPRRGSHDTARRRRPAARRLLSADASRDSGPCRRAHAARRARGRHRCVARRAEVPRDEPRSLARRTPLRVLPARYPPHVRTRFATGMSYAFGRELDDARELGSRRSSPSRSRPLPAPCGSAWRPGPIRRHSTSRTTRPEIPHATTVHRRLARRLALASREPARHRVAVLSLALGIGANTALFSILNSLMLKSLPVARPAAARAVDSSAAAPGPTRSGNRSATAARPIFDDAFAWSSGPVQPRAARGETRPRRTAIWASGTMFDVLGVQAVLGRTLHAGRRCARRRPGRPRRGRSATGSGSGEFGGAAERDRPAAHGRARPLHDRRRDAAGFFGSGCRPLRTTSRSRSVPSR